MRDYYKAPNGTSPFKDTLDLARQGQVQQPYFDKLFSLNIYEMLRSLAVLSEAHFTQLGKMFDDWDRLGTLSNPGRRAYAALKVVRAWRKFQTWKLRPQDVVNLITRKQIAQEDVAATGEPSTVMEFFAWYDDGSFCPERRKIIEVAQNELRLYGAAIEARSDGPDTENNRPLRKGYQRLLFYHRGAFGKGPGQGTYDENAIKFRRPAFKVTRPDGKGGTVEVELVDGMEHWCGIFAVYDLKTAQVQSVRDWTQGGGTWHSGMRAISPATEPPKVGDVGYRDAGNHHFLIAEVSEDGNQVKTIDGNSGTKSTLTASNWKPRGAPTAGVYYSAFFPNSPDGTGDV
jgi:hypothetical protein